MRVVLLCFFWLLLAAGQTIGQTDTTIHLQTERLGLRDILHRKTADESAVSVSATRSLENVSDLPYTVWVVTAEDILLNGYVTLADVLRAAPGIRVSQPGNAVEGETFLMRGLPGNRYVKILINDVPIKPTIAAGMPIAAQLPIRQAERIEVVYGPAAAMYGDEACAGVVNIVLKETERPIFTQADLSFGTLGYNSLDLMMGGKLGKDKRILRFSLYGSSTVREETDILADTNVYNADLYVPFGLGGSLYSEAPNFRADSFGVGANYPKFVPVPHESRMFGAMLTWRGIHFNYQRMGRHDFSALGMNPVAQSWSNPSNILSDRLETFSLGFQVKRRRFHVQNNLSFLRYTVDKNASTSYIFDGLSAAAYYAQKSSIISPGDQKQVLEQIYTRLNSRERYFAASGIDIRLESLWHARPNKYLGFDAGTQFNIGSGAPLLGHLAIPVDLDIAGGTPISPDFNHPIKWYKPYEDGFRETRGSINFFGQVDLNLNNLRLSGSSALFVPFFNADPEVLPRVAASYRIDSTWMIRGLFSKGVRDNAVYERANTFRIGPNGQITPGASDDRYATERIHYLEGGLRFTGASLRADLLAFGQNIYNQSRPGNLWPSAVNDSVWWYGYRNLKGLTQQLWGVEGIFYWEPDPLPVSMGLKGTRNIRIRAEYFVQYAQGKEVFALREFDEVLNQPRWNQKLRLMVQGPKLHFMLATNRQSSVLSKSVTYPSIYLRPIIQDRYPRFSTWDLMLRYYLNNHFLLYFHVINIFDKHYSGLDATGTPDDLLRNPQQGRIVRIGVNYNMN